MTVTEILEQAKVLSPQERKELAKLLIDTLDVQTLDAQPSFDYEAWWARVEALQASISARLGEGKMVGALSLLDELREEE